MGRLPTTPVAVALIVAASLLFGCQGDSLPVASSEPLPDDSASITAEPAAAPDTDTGSADGPALQIDAGAPGDAIDPRLFGTNVPAWLGPQRLSDPAFQRAVLDGGFTLIRMPGGSWSNYYDWLGCEQGDESECFWPWAARPSDFARFLLDTGLEGMWTVSINETAQHAAAAVAFFNGEVDDERPIGVDRDGEDWGTVATWAQLRASKGFEAPIGIDLWEVGNEVYGGKPSSGGGQCVDFGWEEVWTCDGVEYTAGTAEHDGYLAIREAMIEVDPTILVGAVGVGEPKSWSDWGNEVIDAAGEDLDFYVVHEYGFDASPDPDDALDRPVQLWPQIIDRVRFALREGVPIALTEYNLVGVETNDTERRMTQAVNALYTADTLGLLAQGGVEIANHWNIANGVASTGTDYGLVDADTFEPSPTYEAFRLWSKGGSQLLAATDQLPNWIHAYPTRRDDGTLAIILLNLGDEAEQFDVGVAGLDGPKTGRLSGWSAPALDATELVPIPVETLDIPDPASGAQLELPAWSMTLLEITS